MLPHAARHRFSRQLSEQGVNRMSQANPALWWRQLHKTANHGKAFTAVQECCNQHCFARGATARPVLDAFDDSRGHLVRRRVFVCPEAAGLEALDAWSGCIP